MTLNCSRKIIHGMFDSNIENIVMVILNWNWFKTVRNIIIDKQNFVSLIGYNCYITVKH